MRVPDPPDPFPDPLEEIWPRGRPIFRCHDVSDGATEFNSSDISRRFRPVYDAGGIVPTLYGADSDVGALSETVFHDVPIRGAAIRRVQRKNLTSQIRSVVVPAAGDLRLACLHGSGLRRLGTTHAELVESSARQYPRTAAWAQAIYDAGDFDGLVWRSRQNNSALALLLWGTRVDRRLGLEIDDSGPPRPLYFGRGFEMVQELAAEMLITVVA